MSDIRDNNFASLHFQPSLGIKLNRLWINPVFFSQYPGSQGIFRIIIENRDHSLDDDWPCVHTIIDKMNRAACKFYTVFKCLLLHMQTWKGWQQGRMNVQYSPGEGVQKERGEHSHETGQYHQLDIAGHQHFDHLPVEIFPLAKIQMVDDLYCKVVSARSFQCIGIRIVTDYDLDFCLQPTLFNLIDDGLEIGAAPGNQYTNFYFLHL